MNKIVRAMGLIALATMVVATTVSCDSFWSALADSLLSVDGVVVNVQAAKTSTTWWKSDDGAYTLTGATVTLTDLGDSAKTYEGTVDSLGKYAITSVPAGTYSVTGSQPGWSFVPRRVDLTGYSNTLPDILAYVTPAKLDQILVMVEWSTVAMDVDSYMARDTDGDNVADGTKIAGYINGGGNSYYSDPEEKVYLDRDITQYSDEALPRVETIRVDGNSGTTYERLRYYVRLYNQSAGSLTGDPTSTVPASASACVYVMQGRTHLGTYQIAIDSAEQVLGVVQMDWDGPNSQWVIGSYSNPYFINGDGTDTTGIRSLDGGPVVVDSIQ